MFSENTSSGRDLGFGSEALLPLVTTLCMAERVAIVAPALEAFQAAASHHTLLALRSYLTAFDLWCRQHRRITLPASAGDVADYLKCRAEQGAKPASLARYKASRHNWSATPRQE